MHSRSSLRFMSLFLLLSAFTAVVCAGRPTTFQELMDPAVLPDAQFGMEVKSVDLKDGVLMVETTGAEMQWDLAAGKILFEQKIARQRIVLEVQTAPITAEPVITHTGPGLGFVDFAKPDMELRVNGDSLFMIHVHEPVTFNVRRKILPAFHANFDKSSHLLLDEYGGFGLYCSDNNLAVGFDPYTQEGAVTGRYNLAADEVLWIGICPPKAFDWKSSLDDNVIWHWEDGVAYPSDERLDKWAPYGNIYLLQREVVLWKDWNLAFEPRFGMGEWNRVKDKVHGLGKRYMVYTSPSYYYTDSKYESYAFNDYGTGIGYNPVPMLPDGENIDSFLDAITKVMTELKPDGLYFDSQYYLSTPATYRLARESRRIVGENGLLEWHSTLALSDNWCGMMYLPQADAYVDILLRGELFDGNFDLQKYLRYFVSTYNSSNSIGCLCLTNGAQLTERQCELIVRNNARLHTVCWWIHDSNFLDDLQKYYTPRLKPELKEYVEGLSDKRQEAFKAEWPGILAERKSIEIVPSYSKPVLQEEFRSMPDWKKIVSESNSDPFSIHFFQSLNIKAHANTYAFLQKDSGLPEKVRAIQVRIKHSTDGGRAWGPSAALQWDKYDIIKIGTRADGNIFVKVNQDEQLLGEFDNTRWITLRARWGKYFGVIESSIDGVRWQQQLVFEHNGTYYNEKPLSLFAGKVPPLCEANDHSEPGDMGRCRIDYVRLY